MFYRQGDVGIRKVEVPENLGHEVKRDNGRVILAYGEVTGHAHALTKPGVRLFEHEGVRHLLIPEGGADLVHEEHGTVPLPSGTYRIIQQREYTPEEIRNVID